MPLLYATLPCDTPGDIVYKAPENKNEVMENFGTELQNNLRTLQI